MIHLVGVGLAWLLKIAVYVLAGGMTLVVILSAIYGIVDGPRYRGKMFVEWGRHGMLACLLSALWVVALVTDMFVSNNLVTFLDYTNTIAWLWYVPLIYGGVGIGAFILFHIGAYLAPRSMRRRILNFEI